MCIAKCKSVFRFKVILKGDLSSAILFFFLETVTTVAIEDKSGEISAPILGCIVLSITLFLLLFSNAAQCAYYKRRKGKCIQSPPIPSVSWFALAASHD